MRNSSLTRPFTHTLHCNSKEGEKKINSSHCIIPFKPNKKPCKERAETKTEDGKIVGIHALRGKRTTNAAPWPGAESTEMVAL